jgi:hypothetical protein
MRRNLNISLLVTILCCNYAFGQIHIDKKLYFDSSSVNRTIEGIVLAYDSTSGIPYTAFLETKLNYISNQTGSLILNVNLISPLSYYPEGFELFIKSLTSNTGSLFLNVNNLGPVEIKKRDTISLMANEIIPNQIFKVMYDGTYFILQSPSLLKCPTGFTDANDNFCIELNERTAASYLTAVNSCYSINARLCSWGEWYYACQKTSLGLSNMVNNYEYVDDTSDHSNTVLIVGSGSCTSTYTFLLTGTQTHSYRCCYSK